ncbi:MAG: hypothetical protein JXX29_11260 [Deltaproteobacteria bacterium]|nr:hypothetical protein [Deltaproteobacteria bacterium]MBN2672249.1 hypothetical protein [Deltaproteobacteria bacterium]
MAKAVNCSHGRWENLWSSDKTSVIPLESHVDVMDKIAYTFCNPVSAQLFAQAKNWKRKSGGKVGTKSGDGGLMFMESFY